MFVPIIINSNSNNNDNNNNKYITIGNWYVDVSTEKVQLLFCVDGV